MKTDRYSKYLKWYSGLSEEHRDKLDFITSQALDYVDGCLNQLYGEMKIRIKFTSAFQESGDPLNDALKRIRESNESQRISEKMIQEHPDCDWSQLDELLGYILHEIQIGKLTAKDIYLYPGKDERIYNILGRQVILAFGFMDDYLNTNFDRASFDNNTLRNFNSVIEILSYCVYLMQLKILERIPADKISIDSIPLSDNLQDPDLSPFFKDRKVWADLIKDPRVRDHFEIMSNGNFKWIGDKNLLAGFAHRLKNKGKLIESIITNQDLARIFCKYFHVSFNSSEEKSFQPSRIKIEGFYWIQ